MDDKETAREQGTIKWFSNTKGFGFIVRETDKIDIFVHYSSILIDGYRTLKAGQQVTFNSQEGEKGLHAINVVPVGKTI